ncbi:unnamed protein product [Euphydryas editha]|uniref:Endonuclease/exonuclease/phosphatase domain-containing protein n=1 Tax=Euphydryas editha TaxID=104508 RepID=A0AAU9V8R1_EUPED|nr:unnamed protein product [Euphydryas editha]
MTYFMSVYLSPNEGISAFRQKLSNIEDVINEFNGEVIVAGNFNAKSAEWGSVFLDTRGNEVADFAAMLDLTVLNTGNISTFRRPWYQEYILDISLGTSRIARMIKNWIVLEDYSGSNHQHIKFSVEVASTTATQHKVLRNESGTPASLTKRLSKNPFHKAGQPLNSTRLPTPKRIKSLSKKLGKAIPEAPKPPSIMNNIVAELFPKHPPREKKELYK